MSKSLNEAFIRAYSKERSNASGRRQDASLLDDGDPLIVRVDTATVVVPAPHMMNATTRPRVAAAVAGMHGSQATAETQGSKVTGPMTPPTSGVQENFESSDSSSQSSEAVAARFLDEGIWQDHFDAFGIFPSQRRSDSSSSDNPPAASRPTESLSSSPLPGDLSEEPIASDTPVSQTAEIFRAAAIELSATGDHQTADQQSAVGDSVAEEAYAPVLPQEPAYTSPDRRLEVPEEVFIPGQPSSTEDPAESSEVNKSQTAGERAETTDHLETKAVQVDEQTLGNGEPLASVEVADPVHEESDGIQIEGPPSQAWGSGRAAAPASPTSPASPGWNSEGHETAVDQPVATKEDFQSQARTNRVEGQSNQTIVQRNAREPESPTTPALTFEQISQAVSALAAERREQGEIFRLDRPSYSSTANPSEVDSHQDLTADDHSESDMAADEVAADSLGSENSPAFESSQPTEPANPLQASDNQAKNAATRAAEEGLRKARLKIFNPVWEVDALQWPAVCSELLKRRSENLERVAQNLISACQEGLQVLAVTSPSGGEGRTTVACCLAMLAGSHGLNVAILDGDIENPTLSVQTNLDVEQDWKTAMLNQMSLEEVAVHSIDDQVTLLPLLSPIDRNEIASDDNRIAFMLHELSESFDLVIVDMGHMDSTRSLVTTMGEQGMINAVVTVVDLRTSSPGRLDACIRRIRRTGISSIGLVENFAA